MAGRVTADVRRDRALVRALIAWFAATQRDLPWRRTTATGRRDPWASLVSELMLQQTQVARVLDHFEPFLARFPTVRALADADEHAVLAAWSGLGYYRRARALHRAAQRIVEAFDGAVPDEPADLRTLPGVGRYTAGAIASMVFGRAEPIVDGNVARVLARRFAIESAIDQPAAKRQLWSLAGQVVPPRRPGDFNQALMELGAVICLPSAPNCSACPLARRCQARLQARTEELPRKAPARGKRGVDHHILAIRRRGRYLLQRRDDAGLWAGMWQLPTVEDLGTEVCDRAIQSWAVTLTGLELSLPQPVTKFQHMTTHLRITFHLWRVDVAAGRLRSGLGCFRPLHRLGDLPLPNPQRYAMGLLRESE